MDWLKEIFSLGTLNFLLIINVLVLVHELGHFLVARYYKITVEEFGLGFPPRLVGMVRLKAGGWRLVWFHKTPKPEEIGDNTIYSLNCLPIGGFVRPKGEDDPRARDGLAGAPKWPRFAVLAAGSTFNILLAYLLLVIAMLTGWRENLPNTVSLAEVAVDSPAAQAGLLPGDYVRELDGIAITSFPQVSAHIRAHLGEPIEVVIERNGERQTLIVTPRTEWPEGQGPTGMSLTTPYRVTTYAFPNALLNAGAEIGNQFLFLARTPLMLYERQITVTDLRPVGMVGLKSIVDKAAEEAQATKSPFAILGVVAMISVALGLTNLLPIPALDGGRILFVLIEALRGRRVSPEQETRAHMVGIVMLLILMVVVNVNDVINPLFK
jgi:regulator of sigma E protease